VGWRDGSDMKNQKAIGKKKNLKHKKEKN